MRTALIVLSQMYYIHYIRDILTMIVVLLTVYLLCKPEARFVWTIVLGMLFATTLLSWIIVV